MKTNVLIFLINFLIFIHLVSTSVINHRYKRSGTVDQRLAEIQTENEIRAQQYGHRSSGAKQLRLIGRKRRSFERRPPDETIDQSVISLIRSRRRFGDSARPDWNSLLLKLLSR
ncbi:Uncharacterised protein g7215 [Pycnogonum litorale]